ncbi:N-alpha-acetyltransferase 38, NatC auxiliary subunit isoform X2 [Siphateles boraxobius]|uniref:N-alpha-acetyltransferase 38, NatC auxiliary subunit isoform X2 n=1 Tax=Siphateles boraxobius TaxID=180520 RepID=UPI00406453D1
MASESEENGTEMQNEVDESAYSLARCKLENLLNKSMRIRMTDGRTLVGLFLCTDRDCNVILGSAQEFLKSSVTQCTTDAVAFLLPLPFVSSGVVPVQVPYTPHPQLEKERSP